MSSREDCATHLFLRHTLCPSRAGFRFCRLGRSCLRFRALVFRSPGCPLVISQLSRSAVDGVRALESGIGLTHIWTHSPNGCNRRRSKSRGEVTERFDAFLEEDRILDSFRTEVESSLGQRGPNGLSPSCAWPTRAKRSQPRHCLACEGQTVSARAG